MPQGCGVTLAFTPFTRLFVFRPFWYVQLAAPLVAIGGAAAFVAGLPFGMGLLAGRWAAAGVGSVFLMGAIAGYIGSRQLRVKSLQVQFPNLPAGLVGLRIVQISDLHVGPHTSKRFLARVSHAVIEAHADIIAITGDQVDDYPGDVGAFATAFTGLSAPFGVYAIAGNHDVYAGWEQVHAGLRAMGFAGPRERSRRAVARRSGILACGNRRPCRSRRAVGARPVDCARRRTHLARHIVRRVHHRARAQSGSVAQPRRAWRALDLERPHSLWTAFDPVHRGPRRLRCRHSPARLTAAP